MRAGDKLLLIEPVAGRWQLPKGHLESGESAIDAAVREVREETGVTGRVIAPLPTIEYTYSSNRGRVRKRVDYFLMEYTAGDPADFDPREVAGAEWFPCQQALERLTYDNERQIVVSALALDETGRI